MIAEQMPLYAVADDRRSLSTAEYLAMLLGAVQVLGRRLTTLEVAGG